jgi:hypothetical protein
VTVPDKFRDLSFIEVCTQLIVEMKGDNVTLAARKERASREGAARPTRKSSSPKKTGESRSVSVRKREK